MTGTRRDTTKLVTGEPDDRKRSRPVRAGGRWKRTRPAGRHLASGLPERRLRRKQIITRIPGTHRYQLTAAGRAVAVLFTKTYARIFGPGLATLDPKLPPAVAARSPLALAWKDLSRELDRFIDHGLAPA